MQATAQCWTQARRVCLGQAWRPGGRERLRFPGQPPGGLDLKLMFHIRLTHENSLFVRHCSKLCTNVK